MSKTLLVLGASSDMGSELIRRVYRNYDVILAHYNSSRTVIDDLSNELSSDHTNSDITDNSSEDSAARPHAATIKDANDGHAQNQSQPCTHALIPIQADFMDATSIDKMINWVRVNNCYPDHIVHFASPKIHIQRFSKCDINDFSRELTCSFESVVRILLAFMPNMAKQKSGKVIFTLSSDTLNMPPKYQAPYVSAKYALMGLMKSLATEYAASGITVNGVSPEMTQTKFVSEVQPLIVEQNAANNPMKRNLVVNDIIPLYEYLLSDAASMVTGQNIGITGGRS